LNDKSAVLTLTYLGAIRTVPNYNTMGLAKASLEASVRYLAESLGSQNRGLRANGISAGPIKTLAASGIKGFGKILSVVAEASPIRRNVTIEDVGNVAAFMLSDLAAGVTAEIRDSEITGSSGSSGDIYIDSGNRVGIFRIMQALGRHAIPATVAVNAAVALRYPSLIERCKALGWEFIANGLDMDHLHHGALPVEELVTHRVPLEQIMDGFELALHPTTESLKIVVKPQGYSS
jgi:threonine dehydrogenase-like Zn-dependent dehydrogenase